MFGKFAIPGLAALAVIYVLSKFVEKNLFNTLVLSRCSEKVLLIILFFIRMLFGVMGFSFIVVVMGAQLQRCTLQVQRNL